MAKEIKKVPGFKYVKSSDGIHEYQLVSNGLSVLIREDHSAPVAAFMVVYRVGSRNEAVGHTGATHLLEHMMFRGSRKFNRKNGKMIDTVIDGRGGIHNASTSFDRTNYYALMPSRYLEDVIAIEADRMRGAFLRKEDLASEMPVVRGEFEMDNNNPYDELRTQIFATAYLAHPYHHPIIGWKSDVEGVSIDRLRQFYDTFYWPNNAVAVVTGDIDLEKTLAAIGKHFGRMKASPHAIPQVITMEPVQQGQRRLIIRRFGQEPIVGIAHKMCPAMHPDIYALEVLAHALGSGKSSRLHRLLTDKGMATGLYSFAYPLRDPGLFSTYVWLTPNTTPEEAERIIMAEYETIKKDGILPEEVKKAQESVKATVAFSRDGAYAVAESIAEAVSLGDWTFYTTLMSRIEKVTSDDVRRVAGHYLQEDQSTVGFFTPKKS